MSKLKLTQVRSHVGASAKQLDTLRTLGLGKIGRSVERSDHPTLRGNVRIVSHLVKVVPTEAGRRSAKSDSGPDAPRS